MRRISSILLRDIFEDYNDDNDSIQMDITQETMSQASDSMKSDLCEINIIVEFLNELHKLGKKEVWNHISSRMLYKYYLSDAEAINSSFIVAELDLLNTIIKKNILEEYYSKVVTTKQLK